MRNLLLIVGLLLLLSGNGGSNAYVVSGRHWASPPTWYVNPANSSGFTLAQIETALTPVAKAWCVGGQTNASCNSTYGGTTSGRTAANNGKNEVFFAPTNEGSTRTHYFYNTATLQLLDADMIIVDLKYPYFTQTGCVKGIYLEEIAIHEFGHVFGISHSSVANVTMQPLIQGWCSRAQLSLEADDRAAIEFLYKPGPPTPVNTAPTVTIASPANGSSHLDTAAISFAASATDTQDGTLSADLHWTSDVVGEIGVGPSFSRTLPVGVHAITASITDSGGMAGMATRSITVNVAPKGATLSVRAWKNGAGQQKADLTWSGLPGTAIHVYRNGVNIKQTANDGAFTDAINALGSAIYTYKVCELKSVTNCTNEVAAVF